MNMENYWRLQQQLSCFSGGRRPSLLTCMDEHGNVDVPTFIEYSRMKRAHFLHQMNTFFRGGAGVNIPPSMDLLSSSSSSIPVQSTANASGLPQFALSGKQHGDTIYGHDAARWMTMSRTMTTSGSDAVYGNSEATSSPASITAAQPRQLRQDEYEAAEALLFSMGRHGAASPREGSFRQTGSSSHPKTFSSLGNAKVTENESSEEDSSTIAIHNVEPSTANRKTKRKEKLRNTKKIKTAKKANDEAASEGEEREEVRKPLKKRIKKE